MPNPLFLGTTGILQLLALSQSDSLLLFLCLVVCFSLPLSLLTIQNQSNAQSLIMYTGKYVPTSTCTRKHTHTHTNHHHHRLFHHNHHTTTTTLNHLAPPQVSGFIAEGRQPSYTLPLSESDLPWPKAHSRVFTAQQQSPTGFFGLQTFI